MKFVRKEDKKVLEVKAEEVCEVAKEIMETHSEVFEKLALSEKNPNYEQRAYGVYKDSESGQWNVIEISYDPKTLEVNPNVTLIPSGDTDKSAGLERFQITVAQKLIHNILWA